MSENNAKELLQQLGIQLPEGETSLVPKSLVLGDGTVVSMKPPTTEAAKYESSADLVTAIRRNAEDPGGSRPCLRCATAWTPGDWNFHGLCQLCFREFDQQKMYGRVYAMYPDADARGTIARTLGQSVEVLFPYEPIGGVNYFESAPEWMSRFPAEART